MATKAATPRMANAAAARELLHLRRPAIRPAGGGVSDAGDAPPPAWARLGLLPVLRNLTVLALAFVGHRLGLRLQQPQPQQPGWSAWELALLGMALWSGITWATALLCEGLDRLDLRAHSPLPAWLRACKLRLRPGQSGSDPATVPFWSLGRITLRNHVCFAPIGALLMGPTVQVQPPPAADTLGGRAPLLVSLGYMALYYLMYDLLFFAGHRLMHAFKPIFRSIHETHHKTMADRGISLHVMTFPDFLLEGPLPSLVALMLLGSVHLPGWFAMLFGGSFNGVVVHSGWDLPFCSDPKKHYAHHLFPRLNYGVGLTDQLFRTAADSQAMRMLAYERRGRTVAIA